MDGHYKQMFLDAKSKEEKETAQDNHAIELESSGEFTKEEATPKADFRQDEPAPASVPDSTHATNTQKAGDEVMEMDDFDDDEFDDDDNFQFGYYFCLW